MLTGVQVRTLFFMIAVLWGCGGGSSSSTPSTSAAGAGGTSRGGAGATTSSASAGAGGAGAAQPATLFDASVSSLTVEVDYQPGAEPYTGVEPGFGDIWEISRRNMAALFAPAGTTLTIPGTLEEMEELPDMGGDDFGWQEISAIAEAHRDLPPFADGVASLYVVWVDGHALDEDGERNDNILGVSYGDTGIIAMFKPVIESTALPLVAVEKYVEQATLVHELGHAVGLVNNGIAMAEDHQDEAHGSHCDNTECVMYWTIEGAPGAVDFVEKNVTQPSDVLWGDGCLADAALAAQ